MFLLNINCRPKSPPTILRHVLEQATHIAANNPLLIVGDFNAAHPLWGYAYANPRGNLVHKLIEDMDLTLVTDPTNSTRLGTSVTRDTNPDLALTRNIPQADWTHLEEYLGSDHALLATTLHGLEYKARIGTARLTDWAKMRETRSQRPGNEDRQHRLPIQGWITQLHQDVLAHNKTLQTSTTIPCIDARLLHMWEARRSLLKWLKRQRWNRKLKKRIALLTEKAAECATSLCRENWLCLCDGLRGTLSTSKTWKLLRYLINPASGKTESHHNLARVIHQFPGKGADLLLTLKARYFPTQPSELLPPYTGSPNDLLDEDIHLHEVSAALQRLQRHTTLGMDQITNKALINLDSPSLLELTAHLNKVGREGSLPEDWKTAEATSLKSSEDDSNCDINDNLNYGLGNDPDNELDNAPGYHT
ncbi:hypothetical protein ISCGN_003937 [Ixodes scapularis]